MSVTATTTATTPGLVSVRLRKTRRFSASRQSVSLNCASLPPTIEALKLSKASPTHTLASLRFLVLTYLADLERRLADFESPDIDTWIAKGELTFDDASQWASTAIDMLERIRADVYSHLPEVHLADLSSVETFVKSHLPDMPDMTDMRSHLPEMPHMPDMADVRSHLPEMPHLPDMDEVRSHLPDFTLADMRQKLESRFSDLDFQKPLSFIPKLSDHLQNLRSHLSSLEFCAASAQPNSVLADVLDALLTSELVADIINVTPNAVEEAEDMLETAATQITHAVERSLAGMRLIQYADLPQPWRNNPFVTQGYRFIPLERWPLLIMSLFAFHNETLNIHTHLMPAVLWGLSLLLFSHAEEYQTPEILFMCFAVLCLSCSVVWHTMAGCAHHSSMEICARVDYVGIGWLISASVGSVAHYGFQCHPEFGYATLGLCFLTGLAGNIFPFMGWFNRFEYRYYRIAFFLTMAFSSIGPIIGLSMLHSFGETWSFTSPIIPSLLSYLMGLVFYAAHFPECVLSPKVRTRLDSIGCGSHSIWHCFIVLAVSQHKSAIQNMRGGLQCLAP